MTVCFGTMPVFVEMLGANAAPAELHTLQVLSCKDSLEVGLLNKYLS